MILFSVAAREIKSNFVTTTGWLVLAGFLAISGFFWASMVSLYLLQSADIFANPYAAEQMSLADYLLSPYFGNSAVVLIMVVPALSMRLFASEMKQGTMELLLTSPISSFEIVLGKFLGSLGSLLVMLGCTLYVPLTLILYGQADFGLLFTSYLALFCLSGAILSLGMLFSSLTESQVVAHVLTLATALSFWILSWTNEGGDGIVAAVVDGLSMMGHIELMLSGAIRLSDLTYFVCFIAVMLFATVQRVESLRWR